MSRTRTAFVLSTVAAVALASTAAAAPRPRPKPKPKPVCNLITDATGDTFATRAQDGQGLYGPQEDGFDIKGGDIASNATTLTGVLRIAKLANTVGSSPGGIDFRINFVLPGQDGTAENFFLNARIDGSGAQKFLSAHITRLAPNASTTVKLADGTGVFDLARNEVRIHVPLASIKQGSFELKPGMKIMLAALDQTASRNVVVNPATDVGTALFADVANSDKTYVAGAFSCVTPGK